MTGPREPSYQRIMQLSEQEIVRRENLQKIKDLGFVPFPAAAFKVDFNTLVILFMARFIIKVIYNIKLKMNSIFW